MVQMIFNSSNTNRAKERGAVQRDRFNGAASREFALGIPQGEGVTCLSLFFELVG